MTLVSSEDSTAILDALEESSSTDEVNAISIETAEAFSSPFSTDALALAFKAKSEAFSSLGEGSALTARLIASSVSTT